MDVAVSRETTMGCSWFHTGCMGVNFAICCFSQMLSASGIHLLSIVNDILDFTKLTSDAANFALQPVIFSPHAFTSSMYVSLEPCYRCLCVFLYTQGIDAQCSLAFYLASGSQFSRQKRKRRACSSTVSATLLPRCGFLEMKRESNKLWLICSGLFVCGVLVQYAFE